MTFQLRMINKQNSIKWIDFYWLSKLEALFKLW